MVDVQPLKSASREAYPFFLCAEHGLTGDGYLELIEEDNAAWRLSDEEQMKASPEE